MLGYDLLNGYFVDFKLYIQNTYLKKACNKYLCVFHVLIIFNKFKN